MKEYKLKKKYPSLPHDWEIGMIVGTGDRSLLTSFSPCNGKYTDYYIPYREVSNNSEFWEEVKEVKEKDYEILSYECLHPDGSSVEGDRQIFVKLRNGNYKWNNVEDTETQINNSSWNNRNGGYVIHSIKRLSDGEVFQLEDKVNPTNNSYYIDGRYVKAKSGEWKKSLCPTTIESFKIIDEGIVVIFKDDGFNVGQLVQHVEKTKQPLYITEDGKEVYSGDFVYCVTEIFTVGKTQVLHNKKKLGVWKYFFNKEAAQKWIDENKPIYSKKQINHSINILFSPELSRDGNVFGEALKEGYRTAFFKYLENEQT